MLNYFRTILIFLSLGIMNKYYIFIVQPFLFLKISYFSLLYNFSCYLHLLTGGETIKQINQQSGAHCELDRRNQNQQQSGGDKTFVIRGEPDQIETAKRIISDKIQMPINFVSVGMGNNLPTVSENVCGCSLSFRNYVKYIIAIS